MRQTKCDNCKRVSKQRDPVLNPESKWMTGSVAGAGIEYLSYDLCEKCGTKLAKFMRKLFGDKVKGTLKSSNVRLR